MTPTLRRTKSTPSQVWDDDTSLKGDRGSPVADHWMGTVTNIWSMMGLQWASKMLESFKCCIFVCIWTKTSVCPLYFQLDKYNCLLSHWAEHCPRARRQCLVHLILAMDTAVFMLAIYLLKPSKHCSCKLLFCKISWNWALVFMLAQIGYCSCSQCILWTCAKIVAILF